MNRTGTYVYEPGKGLVRVSPPGHVPRLALGVWMPKGDLSYYDKSLRMKIESKAHKRQVLRKAGMREGGLIRNPDKRWDNSTRNSTKPSWESRQRHATRQAYIQSQGGVTGLLDRIEQDRQLGGGRYV